MLPHECSTWSYQRCGWADKVPDKWCAVAREDGHPSLATFARRLERYRYGILNHCRHPMNTGRIEGVNNQIKVIKRMAFGFHDLEYFALKVKQAFPGRPASN
ncbi:MAG: transposase [Planctomycetota bacterium]